MDYTTLLLVVCLSSKPAACDIRPLPFAGTIEECASVGWQAQAAEYLAEHPYLVLRTAACTTGETA
jgi:hypothetical protein